MASYEAMIVNYAAIEKLGASIAKSQMFGASTIDQGIIIATDCYLANMSPIEYARRNKIVNGKPFKQYDTMLAEFHERGGKSRIISKTEELAAIELEFNSIKREFSLSWQDAQKETFPYNGKEAEIISTLAAGKQPQLKAKYATPRSRAIMLFARVVSDAIRSMCPEVNFGYYTPEEIEDLPGGEVAPVRTPANPVAPTQPEVKPPSAPVQVPTPPPPSEVPVPLAGADGPFDDTPDDAPITEDLINKIREVVKVINQTPGHADFSKKLKEKLGEGGLKSLTQGQGRKLFEVLERKEIAAVFELSLIGRKEGN